MGTAVATSVVDHVITADKAPLVKTKHGCVQGFTIDLENRSKADVFLGVPFAKPPTEELKFEVGKRGNLSRANMFLKRLLVCSRVLTCSHIPLRIGE